MNRRKRPFWLLVISLLSFAGLLYLIFFLPPSKQFSLPLGAKALWGIPNFQFPILIIFFSLLFFCLLFLTTYLFRNTRRGTTIGVLIVVYLIFRMLHLNSLYFLLLLIALFISLELFFKKRI